MIPRSSPSFDETIEAYIRFVQGANSFVSVNEYQKIFILYLWGQNIKLDPKIIKWSLKVFLILYY